VTDTTKPGSLSDEMERAFLEQRRIFFSDDVNQESAAEAIRKLWFLDYQDRGKPITMVINSPGGSVDAGFAVWDQAKMIKAPITTLVTGLAASMGSILAQCADPKRRFSTRNCRILIHQPAIHGAVRGQATDLEIQAREILKTRERIVDLYVAATGKDVEEIRSAIERDRWFDAAAAQDFGLIDGIVDTFAELE